MLRNKAYYKKGVISIISLAALIGTTDCVLGMDIPSSQEGSLEFERKATPKFPKASVFQDDNNNNNNEDPQKTMRHDERGRSPRFMEQHPNLLKSFPLNNNFQQFA